MLCVLAVSGAIWGLVPARPVLARAASVPKGAGEARARAPSGAAATSEPRTVRPRTTPTRRAPAFRATRSRLVGTDDRAARRPTSGGWFHWSHAVEWGAMATLFGVGLGVQYGVPPIERSFRPDDERISRPTVSGTYPTPLLTLTVAVPLATFALAQVWSRSWHDFHHAALGISEAFSMTLLVTALLKVTVGRLRPDFLDRCQPDADLHCTGDPGNVAEGRRSFPSGHASLSFSGATFLSLYLWGKLAPFRGWHTLWKVPAILAPLLCSSLIALSRVTDYRHHWGDVIAGSLIGTGFAALGYFLHYHPPWSAKSGQPRRRGRVTVTPVAGAGSLGLAVTGGF